MPGSRTLIAAICLLLAAPSLSFAQSSQSETQAEPPENSSQEPAALNFNVTVIGTTPLPGVDIELVKIPAPVQLVNDREMVESGALNLSDLMNRRMNGVHVNEVQGNPFQTDVNYRGYTASPLLGTPQGLSVYMDGVRLEPASGRSRELGSDSADGDFVEHADAWIESAVRAQHARRRVVTPDERRAQQRGNVGRSFYGADARRSVEFEHGGSRTAGLHWYVAGNLFAEDGWREDSPTDVRQLFGSSDGCTRAVTCRSRLPTPTTL